MDLSEIIRNVQALPDRVEDAVVGYGETWAKRLEAEAKEKRRWRDHTGQARQRLRGECERTDTGVRISLGHGVDYGPKLEFGYQKRYAIVYPTLRNRSPDILQGMQRLFEKMG